MLGIPHIFAFTAGLISFLAPCVLPLIPGYLAYLAGSSLNESRAYRKEIFLNALLFVIGFSFIFSLVGVLLNSLLDAVAYDTKNWLARIGGLIVIFFGLYLTGIFKIPFFEREHKVHVTTQLSSRYATSLLFGAAFAAGWTPCAGAALGSILGLAASEPGSAFTLLLVYSVGFSLPFLLISFFVGSATVFIKRYLSVAQVVNVIFGLILIVFGIAIFTQTLTRFADFEFINRWLLR